MVYFVSLGCARNRVDTEHMIGIVEKAGFGVAPDPESADAVVVNTCSFIGDAKKESVDTVLQFCPARTAGRIRSLVVTGCMPQRYSEELATEIPEVDHFLGTSDYTRVAELLRADLDRRPAKGRDADARPDRQLVSAVPRFLARYDLPRVNTLHPGSAYLKISEGCDNQCAFCIIPQLRGAQRSRTVDDLVREAEGLAGQGVKELTLIAEDLTAWGSDLPGRPHLAEVLKGLSSVDGVRWIRCMYAYPRAFPRDLVRAFADLPRVLPYLDIPVQHGSNRVLKLMRRGRDQDRLRQILQGLRDAVPRMVLRTTVLVGFPGEEERDVDELLEFMTEMRFERLGCFKYSDEEDTPAHDLPGRVPAAVKRARWRKVMAHQKRISRAHNRALVGTTHEAIIEGLSPESDLVIQGRLWSQAPEVDGVTYVTSPEPLTAGEIVRVRVTQAHDYDLAAEVADDDG